MPTADTTKLNIAIIGAGVAGLTAAIALKDHPGVDIQIYERAFELLEIGASIALGPNGLRTLEKLGIDNALAESVAFRNKSGFPMIYHHYQTHETVSVDTHIGDVEYRHQTSRFHRAHLQKALLQHIDPSRIHLGKSFESVDFQSSSRFLHITFKDGSHATADVLLGADGIQSAVRQFFVPGSRTKWTGWVTFRSVFPISHVQHIPDLPDESIHIWGPDRMLFVSPINGDLFTIVGSYQSDPDAPDAPYKDSVWNSDGDVDVLREYYKDWSPLARSLIDANPYTRIYPNTATHSLDTWALGGGRVTLAGDAAHAHGGAFAAGGSLAIDDAWAFAASILQVFPPSATQLPTNADITKALWLYEHTRKPHTDQLQSTILRQNKNSVQRVEKKETDEELRNRMKSRGDTTWIHEHDVEGAFAKILTAEDKRAQ